jgi:hypothetical protein
MSVDRYSVGVKRTDHAEWRGRMAPGGSDRQWDAIAGSGPIHPTGPAR